MIVVLDASAAIEIVLKRENAHLYVDQLLESEAVIAPDIYLSEVANAAWKYFNHANYTHEQTLELALDSTNLIDQFVPVKELWIEALRESICFNHPVYDSLYAVCARRNDGILLTQDKRLQILCEKLHVKYM